MIFKSKSFKINNKIVSQRGTEDPLHRILSFRKGSCAMLLALDESSLTLDSDFKGNLLESVSMALMRRLEHLHLS